MHKIIEIRAYLYLKRPKFKWTIHNEFGGSSSNSGEYDSYAKCERVVRERYPDIPIQRVDVTGFDDDGNAIEEVRSHG
jgi:hypothetical protein